MAASRTAASAPEVLEIDPDSSSTRMTLAPQAGWRFGLVTVAEAVETAAKNTAITAARSNVIV
jgi:hypothetical protein